MKKNIRIFSVLLLSSLVLMLMLNNNIKATVEEGSYLNEEDYQDNTDNTLLDETNDIEMAEDEEEPIIPISTELENSYTSSIASIVATSDELQQLINNAVDNTPLTINLETAFTFDNTVVIPNDKNIIVQSENSTITLILANGLKEHFIVKGSLTLLNIDLQGNPNGQGGIHVDGGSLEIDGTTTIQSGNGVLVQNGSFVMKNGLIKNNKRRNGAGVWVEKNSYFKMMNGEITGNTAENYGGGVGVNSNSTFVMESGSIDNNIALADGGGGGIYFVNGAKVIMNGGIVEYNIVRSSVANGAGVMGGALAYSSTAIDAEGIFEMNGGEISNNRLEDAQYGGGGGIALVGNSKAIFNDGKVSNNYSNYTGGGVYMGRAFKEAGVQFEMNGGEISYNEALAGAGFMIENSAYPNNVAVFTMNSGSINNNEAISFYGGGLCVMMADVIMGKDESYTPPKIHDNYSVGTAGGIMSFYDSSLVIENAEIYNNNANSYGGGIVSIANADFIMNNGKVYNNEATLGGGIFANESKLNITGGEIFNNIAEEGGGLFISETTESILSNSHIYTNVAESMGGGLYIDDDTDVEMISNAVEGNKSVDGGGLYIVSTGNLKLTENNLFKDNCAENEGGAIYTEDYDIYDVLTEDDYQNLEIDNQTTFISNVANAVYEPADIVFTYDNIKFKSSSFTNDFVLERDHLINNYDINYVSEPPIKFYTIVYHPNGGSGTIHNVRLAIENEHTVFDNTSDFLGYVYHGYKFMGWSLYPDAIIITYTGKSINEIIKYSDVDGDIFTLYAVWEKVEAPQVDPVDPKNPTEPKEPSDPLIPKEPTDSKKKDKKEPQQIVNVVEGKDTPVETSDSTDGMQLLVLLIMSMSLILVQIKNLKRKKGNCN